MANEAFFTAAGSFDAGEMRKYNAALVDSTSPGGVVAGMTPSYSAPNVGISSGTVAIADGAGGVYIVRQTTATSGITPPTSAGTYTIWAAVMDPGSGGTAGEVAYTIASSAPALSIPLGTVVVPASGAPTVSGAVGAGGRRVAKVLGVSDGGNAATVNGHTEAQLSVATAANALLLGGKAEGSLNVASAASATSATSAGSVSNGSANMRFNWSGKPNQPLYMWGSEDSGNAYVYNPSWFRVAYAEDAAGLTTVTSTTFSSSGNYTFSGGTPLNLPSVNGVNPTNATAAYFRNSDGALMKTSSSQRYKKDITDFDYDVDKLRQLRPVYFAMDTDNPEVDQEDDGRQHAGFIAEEIQEVFPVAASLNPDGSVENFDDRAMLAGAYRLIGDLYAKIEALEARLA